MNGSIETAFFGALGRPPDTRTAKSGKEWLSLSVAVGKDDSTQWVSVAVFGDRAIELAEALQKGDRVAPALTWRRRKLSRSGKSAGSAERTANRLRSNKRRTPIT